MKPNAYGSQTLQINESGFSPSRKLLSVALASALLMVGCGSDDDDGGSSSSSNDSPLLEAPTDVSSFTADELDASLAQLDAVSAQVTPDAVCDVDVQKIVYRTYGVQGEETTASAAVMIPSGDAEDCQGERPILLHAHGTAVEKSYDFSQVGNADNEAGMRATMMAANFAAQGYVVVAPNYAGYDVSDLDYHPYLNAQQQSEEMVTALEAARDALEDESATTGVTDSGKLFITGYSQGGHVAMATARYMQTEGMSVTAVAPMSGPYALAAFGDAMFSGNVNLGATVFAPMLAENYQLAYGNIYDSDPAEVFTSQYADGILDVIPSSLTWDELLASGQIPASAMFQEAPTGLDWLDALSPANPSFSYGFSETNYLMNTSFRAAYLSDAQANPDGLFSGSALPTVAANPQNGLRQAFKKNDLRAYTPEMPMLLCGGNQDPMVFYDVNTTLFGGLWEGLEARFDLNMNATVLDVDVTNAADRTNYEQLTYIGEASELANSFDGVASAAQTSFATVLSQVANNAAAAVIAQGGDQATAQQAASYAVLTSYHGSLVAPVCTSAAREYFKNFM